MKTVAEKDQIFLKVRQVYQLLLKVLRCRNEYSIAVICEKHSSELVNKQQAAY